MIAWLFACSGVAVGAMQAGLLERSVRRGPGPVGLFVRLGMVAAVLVVAARFGHLVPGATGWFAGFLTATMIVSRRLR
jgi:hypothetical protein